MSNRMDEDWVRGRASLGAAAAWTAEEIRLIADLGFALAEYGRDEEALTIFDKQFRAQPKRLHPTFGTK